MVIKILILALCVIISHENFQGRYPFHHFVFKGSEFGHHGHETRILTFYTDLLSYSHFFSFPLEEISGLIVGRMS